MSVAITLLVPIATGALLLSSVIWGSKIGATSDAVGGGGTIAPRKDAFSIWGFIYVGLLILAVAQFYVPVSVPVRALLATSLFLSAAWTPLFVQSQFVAAAIVLLCASGTAIAATGVRAAVSATVPQRLLVDLPLGIYTGWLCVAALLGVVIAARGGREGTAVTARAVLLCALAVAALANPALVVGPIIALAFSQKVDPPLFVVLGVGAIAGVARISLQHIRN